MTHRVKHRGPDGYGMVYFDGIAGSPEECFHDTDGRPEIKRPRLGLGARRLAILDLSKQGSQPMQIREGQFWITYNGEIYNYVELRAELEMRGHRFRSRTDTEVILRAYDQWGTECLSHFQGMWSFAIYDRRRHRLFCSRDRFGIKPFYYFASLSLFLFGSEIKQIVDFPGIARRVNERIAFQYLEQGILDHSQETFFAGILQLPGGHSLLVDLSQPEVSLRVEKYWELPLKEDDGGPERVSIERLGHLFHSSVSRHMRSDVMVGSCLSGGLDSSAIVAVASAAHQGQEFHSFSACFDQEALDERRFIGEVVAASGLNSHLIFPNAKGFWDDLNCLIWHQDEPLGGASVYAQWCVMRAARQAHIPVLLDGQGGDEIFCGYRKFYVFYLWQLWKSARLRALGEGVWWALRTGGRNWSWRHARRYIGKSRRRKNSLVTRTCSKDFIERSKEFPYESIGPGENLQQRQKDDLTRFSLPTLLHCEDRNSMAHSIESRVPMLDHDLATFAVNCRPELKLRNGATKWILREALKGTLTDKVRLRMTKLGFEAPQRDWILNDASGTVRSLQSEAELRLGRILSPYQVQSEFQKFLEGQPTALTDMEVFRVMNLELWSRIFKVA
jgi:asparagine synthase (glutamine-hydrolysing)